MPRITRKNQKVFAVNAANNGVFGSLQANDPTYSQDPDVIQARTAYSNGWNDATFSAELLPPLEEFQGLQYLFSRQLSYLFQEGVAEWNTDTTYYIGSIVKEIDGSVTRMYLSTVDNNQGHLPTDTTRWYCFFDSSSAYANVDMNNLTSTGKNISNWSSNVTNCITNIPQDIKLELNAGTLTLKAGSKIYVPNGFEQDEITPKFDIITIQSDISYTQPSTDVITAQVFYNTINNTLMRRGTNPGSGSSVPSGFNSVFYNTSTNLCYNYTSGTQGSKVSFPICICTSNGQATNNISSIDQVFNGFGYIGATVFALPGLKGLIPNGRNADGTLKSTVAEITAVTTKSYSGTQELVWGFTAGNNIYYQTQGAVIYDEEKNTTSWQTVIFASGDVSGGTTISNFVPKTVFHAVDYSDADITAIPKVGFISQYGGSTAPSGWLICDGSAVSRTTYAKLFSVIGTTYGSGDGSTTFNLPNIDGIVKSVNTSVPIKGTGMTLGLTNGSTNGAVIFNRSGYMSAYTNLYGSSVGTGGSDMISQTFAGVGVTTDSTKSGIEGTVTRSSVSFRFIIKY